jgi:cytidylate kinase
MHRMEQLAQAAAIELDPEGSWVLLNGEDVTGAIRAPEVASAASMAAAISRRAAGHGRQAENHGGLGECRRRRP